jgi:serine/threonine protein kinase
MENLSSKREKEMNESVINDESKDEIKEIDKYTLVKIIGRGTFGVVYLGENKENLSEKVAIKRYFRNLHPNLCQLEVSILAYLK